MKIFITFLVVHLLRIVNGKGSMKFVTEDTFEQRLEGRGRGPYRYLGDQSLRLREHTVQRGYAGMFMEE